jgi:hypothetical protein
MPLSWFRVSVLSFAFIALGVGALIWSAVPRSLQKASQGSLVATTTPGPAEPQGTVFPEPVAVRWGGNVQRFLAGGRGAEMKSIEAPGGYFFAYDDVGLPATLSEGPVLITGSWLGISCEYGRCAPEVNVESIEPLPIEPG